LLLLYVLLLSMLEKLLLAMESLVQEMSLLLLWSDLNDSSRPSLGCSSRPRNWSATFERGVDGLETGVTRQWPLVFGVVGSLALTLAVPKSLSDLNKNFGWTDSSAGGVVVALAGWLSWLCFLFGVNGTED